MKRFACVCLGLMLMSMGLGCCCWPGCGGGMYPGYNSGCPGGACGVGYYPPAAAAAYSTYDTTAPVAVAPTPVYYPTTAMNYLPTY